jgi:hypothetical protein
MPHASFMDTPRKMLKLKVFWAFRWPPKINKGQTNTFQFPLRNLEKKMHFFSVFAYTSVVQVNAREAVLMQHLI